MICIDCKKGKFKGVPNTSKSPLYCEICGFGFLRAPDGTYTDVTCLRHLTYQSAVEAGIINDPDFVPVKPAIKDISPFILPDEKAYAKPAAKPVNIQKEQQIKMSTDTKSVTLVDSKIVEANIVLETIKANPLIGKSRIIELSKIDPFNYLECIKYLLAKNLIEQEGKKRGSVYRAKNISI